MKSKKFSVGLVSKVLVVGRGKVTRKKTKQKGGPLCSQLPQALVLEDWESYRFLYESVFVNRPHVLYLGRGPKARRKSRFFFV